jgi:hypothetical protein
MSASTGIAGRLDEQPELVEHAARIAPALYFALRRVGAHATLLAGFVLLIAVLDLAVTWSNHAARIRLSPVGRLSPVPHC